MRFAYDCPLRWSDMDAYGHLNNSRFLTLYEEARVALFFLGDKKTGLMSVADGVARGEHRSELASEERTFPRMGALVIARNEVDYLRPVDYARGPDGSPRPPLVRIELWVCEVRPSRLTVDYELFDGDVVASRARSVCVPFDLATRSPRRLSDDERAFLADWVA